MGKLQVNGNISATGSISVNNTNSSGGITMWEDGEGGTLTIASKNNTYVYHIDAYNDETIRIHTADKNPNGTAKFLSWNGKTGVLKADSFSGTATNSNKLGGFGATEFFRRGDNITASCNDITTSRSYWSTNTATEAPSTWGGLLDFNTGSHHQLFLSYTGNESYVGLYTRAKVNGVWQPWSQFLNENNYTAYTVTKTGSGASGTWGINVTGSAGSVAWGNVTGKPSLMPASPGSIELFPGSSAGHGGFIDFHYNNSSSDYTARIINWNGTLQVDGATLNVGGKVELWSDSEGGNIRITSPNGSLWSIDALSNSSMRFIWAEREVPFAFYSNGLINCTSLILTGGGFGASLPASGSWGQLFFKI